MQIIAEYGGPPYVALLVKSANPLLADAPWGVCYGRHGTRVFATRRIAERWIARNLIDLTRGINPDTGEVMD